MTPSQGITVFGIIEILIGSVTLSGVGISALLGISQKPPGVLIFVVGAATTSISLGIGILKRSRISYDLLLFFAALVFISKILIFTKVFVLPGALETIIPQSFKDTTSLIYHALLIWYFTLPPIKGGFGKNSYEK